ncbi:RDD family protein [Hymenobacter sp. IS2118]|uniref:RDD family protein n=1 Tax=Hymenobacter sp. IS2118 TaxID=1505605 RepID=UPI001269870F
MEVNLFKRLLSSAIDAAIIYVISVTFAGEIYGRLLTVGGFSNSGPASCNILIAYEVFAAVFVFLIYYSFLESKFGSSVGKFIFNISVINNSGNKPSFNQALLRNFSKLNPYTFYSLIIGVNSHHDKVAQTVVVTDVTQPFWLTRSAWL